MNIDRNKCKSGRHEYRLIILYFSILLHCIERNTNGKHAECNHVKKGSEPKKQPSRIFKYMKINIRRILHTWRWPCRPKHVVKDSGKQHIINLHADGNITCNSHWVSSVWIPRLSSPKLPFRYRCQQMCWLKRLVNCPSESLLLWILSSVRNSKD
jgi:hypothetical protein